MSDWRNVLRSDNPKMSKQLSPDRVLCVCADSHTHSKESAHNLLKVWTEGLWGMKQRRCWRSAVCNDMSNQLAPHYCCCHGYPHSICCVLIGSSYICFHPVNPASLNIHSSNHFSDYLRYSNNAEVRLPTESRTFPHAILHKVEDNSPRH